MRPQKQSLQNALLALVLLTRIHADETPPSLRTLLKPDQIQALETSETLLRKIVTAQLTTRDQKPAQEIIRLLDLPRKPAPKPADLIGKWKVRSLQAAPYGVFTYPFFDCQIHQEGELGLIFHKDTGSQRRLGNLAPDGPTRFLFAGGAYVQGESSRGFSGFQDESTKPDASHDSLGYLYQIAPGHFILIFTSTKTNGELYELKKP